MSCLFRKTGKVPYSTRRDRQTLSHPKRFWMAWTEVEENTGAEYYVRTLSMHPVLPGLILFQSIDIHTCAVMHTIFRAEPMHVFSHGISRLLSESVYDRFGDSHITWPTMKITQIQKIRTIRLGKRCLVGWVNVLNVENTLLIILTFNWCSQKNKAIDHNCSILRRCFHWNASSFRFWVCSPAISFSWSNGGKRADKNASLKSTSHYKLHRTSKICSARNYFSNSDRNRSSVLTKNDRRLWSAWNNCVWNVSSFIYGHSKVAPSLPFSWSCWPWWWYTVSSRRSVRRSTQNI